MKHIWIPVFAALVAVTPAASPAQNALNIPPLLTGTTFQLNVQTGTQNLVSGNPTPTYGVNGPFLAPTLRLQTGDTVTLNVQNGLNVPTTMHWHGMHVAAEHDGGPHQIIAPGSTWSPRFQVMNPASTLWYHPHGAGQTDPQVTRGLAGMIIIEDGTSQTLGLPRSYGQDDFPVIIQSKAFDALNQFAIATEMDTLVLINGTRDAVMRPPAQVIRMRLLNGSSMRVYHLGFQGNRPFYQIATDGGLMAAPVQRTRVTLAPGERAEILLDLTQAESQHFMMLNYGAELPHGVYGADSVGSGMDTIPDYPLNPLNGQNTMIMQIEVQPALPNAVTSIPQTLVPYLPPNPATAVRTRVIELDTLRALPFDPPMQSHGPFGINGAFFDMDSINAVCYLNDVEIWKLINRTTVAHPFHIHDIQFGILERSGMPPGPEEQGWKDVVLVMPGDSVSFITQFTDFADTAVPYMYHCHMLHHEDDGMMGSFLVLDTLGIAVTPPQQAPELMLWPNPAQSVLHLQLPPDLRASEVQIRVTDAAGRVVWAERGVFPAGTHSLPVSTWVPGIYLVHLRTQDAVYSRTCMIQPE